PGTSIAGWAWSGHSSLLSTSETISKAPGWSHSARSAEVPFWTTHSPTAYCGVLERLSCESPYTAPMATSTSRVAPSRASPTITLIRGPPRSESSGSSPVSRSRGRAPAGGDPSGAPGGGRSDGPAIPGGGDPGGGDPGGWDPIG